MTTLKFYSFYYGTDCIDHKNWILMDIKLPAPSIKAALFLFFAYDRLMRSRNNKKISDIRFIQPDKKWVDSFVMKVIEYERVYTPSYGYTRHSYKKVRIYSNRSLVKMF